MRKCPFCSSSNIEQLNSNNIIPKKYIKVDGNMTTNGYQNYLIGRFLCLNCGMEYNKMEDDILEKYKKDKTYFC